MPEPLVIDSPDGPLAGECWRGAGAPVVLLHAGVADRRSWRAGLELLDGEVDAVAYDLRGYGASPPQDGTANHLDDLIAVLDALALERVLLVGNSIGGGLALDAALAHPERVAGLALIAPATSGAPEPALDADTQRLSDHLDAAYEAGDLEAVNELEAWLWLDGPTSPNGRVGGAVRELLLQMNGAILARELPEADGAGALEAWPALEQIAAPALVTCGELDVPAFRDHARTLATRLPSGAHRELAGVAHLPCMERPQLLGELLELARAHARL